MSPRKYPWLWGSMFLLLCGLTFYCLPCVPCPREAHGFAGPHGCIPCWDKLTPAEWLSLKIRIGR